MTPEEKELIEVKFAGLHAAIEAWQNIQKITDTHMREKVDTIIALQKITNGRVNKLEGSFFGWFNSSFRVALFFMGVMIVDKIVNYPPLWAGILSIIRLI